MRVIKETRLLCCLNCQLEGFFQQLIIMLSPKPLLSPLVSWQLMNFEDDRSHRMLFYEAPLYIECVTEN